MLCTAGYFRRNFIDVILDLESNIYDIIVAFGNILPVPRSSGELNLKFTSTFICFPAAFWLLLNKTVLNFSVLALRNALQTNLMNNILTCGLKFEVTNLLRVFKILFVVVASFDDIFRVVW